MLKRMSARLLLAKLNMPIFCEVLRVCFFVFVFNMPNLNNILKGFSVMGKHGLWAQ